MVSIEVISLSACTDFVSSICVKWYHINLYSYARLSVSKKLYVRHSSKSYEYRGCHTFAMKSGWSSVT